MKSLWIRSSHFDHSKYHDDYRAAPERLIEAKLAGEVITAPTEKAPVGDVVDQLLASINLAGVKK